MRIVLTGCDAVPDAGAMSSRRSPQERSTRQKRALAALLESVDGFHSAQDLYGELRDRGQNVGLTTVYTQLRALADAGQVDAVRADDGETLYRRCQTGGHHHHLVCRECGRTVEIEGPEVERWAERVAAGHGFGEIRHTVEIVGTCGPCTAGGSVTGSGDDDAAG